MTTKVVIFIFFDIFTYMKILAIETSCDETALALIKAEGDLSLPKFEILKTALFSQASMHAEFGGVFPSLAKREHAKNLLPLLGEILESRSFDDSNVNWSEIEELLHRETELVQNLRNFVITHEKPDIDFIAVTEGPGLEPALWVGINFAIALSIIWQIPVLPVNHMEGHIASVLVTSEKVEFPALALLISGGHTEIVLIKNWGEYEILGQTKDDAIGEAYDKVARMLNLPYPGGPEISKLAKEAREENLSDSEIVFPRPMIGSKDYDFSLSGLKTAVLYKVQKIGELSDENKKNIAREFEQSIVDVLNKKIGNAIKEFGVKNLIVGGGVIANQYIRDELNKTAKENGAKALFPEIELSTDNASMIAIAGFLKKFRTDPKIGLKIRAVGNLKLDS